MQEKEEITFSSFFKALIGITIVLISCLFLIVGTYGMVRAALTEYPLQSLDVTFFAFGLLLLVSLSLFIQIMNIQKTIQAIAGGTLALVTKAKNEQEKNIFNNMQGTVKVFDMSNPENAIFEKEFNSIKNLMQLRDEVISKLLGSEGEFEGQKMTKQEMLDKMSLDQLEKERHKAEQDEDWVWAAAVRDKIVEKKKEL
jgi:hypothetical protein